METSPPVYLPQDLGIWMRTVREQRGLTQAELAQRAGVGRVWLVQFEAGLKDGARLDVVLRLLAILNAQANLRGLAPRQADPALRATPQPPHQADQPTASPTQPPQPAPANQNGQATFPQLLPDPGR